MTQLCGPEAYAWDEESTLSYRLMGLDVTTNKTVELYSNENATPGDTGIIILDKPAVCQHLYFEILRTPARNDEGHEEWKLDRITLYSAEK